MKYFPLHVHTTTGSIGDSILRVKDYVARAKEYGLDALAITDHGSMSAIYEFADACKSEGITPVFGMEAYEVDDHTVKTFTRDCPDKRYHLVLLAQTTEGFHNLLKIHNIAQIDGLYKGFPRADIEVFKKYGKGIVALSACVAGRIPQAILKGKENPDKDIKAEAVKWIQNYKNAFDAFYLEIQPGNFEEQHYVNRYLVSLARETDTQLVVTNDIHYLNQDDYFIHDMHVKLKRAKTGKPIDQENLSYPSTDYWFMDYDALTQTFVYDDIVTREVVDEAVQNADQLIHSCHVEFSTEMHAPKYPLPEGITEKEALYMICYDQLMKIIEDKPNPAAYIDRLKRELDVIDQKHFCGYFLIVADYIEHARKHGIPVGPGRGSAAGSLVTYLLGICQVDPVQYGLLFERFLDIKKKAWPD